MDSISLNRRPSHKRVASSDSTTITETRGRYVVKLRAKDTTTEPTPKSNFKEHPEACLDKDIRNQSNPEFRISHEFNALDRRLQALVRDHGHSSCRNTNPIRRVFLTGATGYIGTQVLRQLIEMWYVDVVVLARGSSEHEARSRVVQKAKEARWWSAKYADKFQVWLGDLAAPNLGLSADQWETLCGQGSRETSIQGFIHAGAAVDWRSSAECLWSTNVAATSSMLEAAVRSPFLRSFVYVSGETHGTFATPAEVTNSISHGYGQTKALGQLLVRRVATMPNMQKNFKSLQTGFVIGTPTEGIPNTNDIFWRFVATAAELRSYDHEQSTSFINVSSVDVVSHGVIEQTMTMRHGLDAHPEITIRNGIQQSMLWQCLARKLGHKMRPTLHEEWQLIVSTSIDAQKDRHKLSAFQSMLKGQEYALPSMSADTFDLVYNEKLHDALNLNIAHLQSVGFLSAADNTLQPTMSVADGSTSRERMLEIFFGPAA